MPGRRQPTTSGVRLVRTRSPALAPRGLHALVIGVAVVYASNHADLLDLEFSPQLWRRARRGRAHPPQDLALEGLLQVTLHLRTDARGRLRNSLALLALEPAPTSFPPGSLPRWEVIGQVVRVDPAARQVIVRVLPPARRVKPFLLILSLPQDAAWPLPKLTRWHFAGRVVDERLLLEAVRAVASGEESSPLGPVEASLERSGAGGEG